VLLSAACSQYQFGRRPLERKLEGRPYLLQTMVVLSFLQFVNDLLWSESAEKD
jgi:hypothetical protein